MKKLFIIIISLTLTICSYSQEKILISSGVQSKEIPKLYMSVSENKPLSVIILITMPSDFYGNFSEVPITIKLDNNEIVRLIYCGNAYPTANNAGALFLIQPKAIEKLKKHKIKVIKVTMYGAVLFYTNIKEPEYFMNILKQK